MSCSNKMNKKKVLTGLLKVFRSFMSFTSLHGIEHIGDDIEYFNKISSGSRLPKRYLQLIVIYCRVAQERMCDVHFLILFFISVQSFIRMLKWLSIIVWITSFLFCAIFALIITTWIWQRCHNTPTLTTIESLYYPVSNLPFPSLTLCNMNIVHRSSMEKNFLSKM